MGEWTWRAFKIVQSLVERLPRPWAYALAVLAAKFAWWFSPLARPRLEGASWDQRPDARPRRHPARPRSAARAGDGDHRHRPRHHGDRLPDAVLRQAGANTAGSGRDRPATRNPAVPGVRLPVAGRYIHGRRRAPRVRQIDRKRSSRTGERDRAAAD